MHTGNRQLFLQTLAQTSPDPLLLEVVDAEGCWLTDPQGVKYLDLISGISVSSLGHRRAEIVDAVKQQSDRYFHVMVYGELVQSPQIKLAEALQQVLPAGLNSFYFVNSGSEAMEGAMKLAKRYTGRSGFAAQTDAYHGSTQGALSLMSNEYYSQAFRPLLPQVVFIRQNTIEDILHLPDNLAAVVIELVQAERGCEPATQEFALAIRDFCKRTGALLVIDEIQTGMGRSGKMFAFEHYGIEPDILLLGKALGGGLPMGAFIANKELMDSLSNRPVLGHITTFGGNALCCAAAEQAVKITASELEQFRVAAKEQLFRQLLAKAGFHKITGTGLLLAAHTPSEEICKKLIRFCLDKGVFTDWFLYNPSALRIAPPLSISESEIRFACAIIEEGYKKITEFGGDLQ
jgi:acetylornithine/succinyldiaminopimelate/putrescine aminotransferase